MNDEDSIPALRRLLEIHKELKRDQMENMLVRASLLHALMMGYDLAIADLKRLGEITTETRKSVIQLPKLAKLNRERENILAKYAGRK